MLYWLVFFIIALVAAIFGFTGIEAAAGGVAESCLWCFWCCS